MVLLGTFKHFQGTSGYVEVLLSVKVSFLLKIFKYLLGSTCYNKKECFLRNYSLSIFSQLLSPFAPHHAEEIWFILGNKGLVSEEEWPNYNNKFFIFDNITTGVQVNGKLRGTITYKKDLGLNEIERLALSLSAVKKHLSNKKPKKIIVVPGKIVNVVV